jgi:hypothetical protein
MIIMEAILSASALLHGRVAQSVGLQRDRHRTIASSRTRDNQPQ